MVFPKSAFTFDLPEMTHVQQMFPNVCLPDIDEAVEREFEKGGIGAQIKPGHSVAILAGSRGICDIHKIIRAVVANVKKRGGQPFIVPAMGSHGNGIAEEQQRILETYGITEEFVGAPIKSSMDTVIVGRSSDGVPVHADAIAAEADLIIPVCRIKCHTDFHGAYESGICKMLTIGLGKHNGCARLHQENFDNFATILPNAAKVVIDKLPVAFAVAVIENAHGNLHSIWAVPAERILEDEPQLLKLSKSLMPVLQFPEIDVLIVERFGKDISGGGMDSNIIGRLSEHPPTEYSGPRIKRIVVNDLTDASLGNVDGLGVADFITKKFYRKIDFSATYTNCIASFDPRAGRLPMVIDDEEMALRAAIFTCPQIDFSMAKVVRILDTLHIVDIEVSPALLEQCKNNPHFKI